MEESVVFKGSVNGLTIILKEKEEFEHIFEQIKKKVSSSGKFFKDAVLNVKYKGKKLTKEQEKLIMELLATKSGAKIKSISGEDDDLKKEEVKRIEEIKKSNYFFKDLDEGPTKFHKGTVRSGQKIEYFGNLVIIGDVNPSAEIISRGNVVVMGTLRGIVHAGADGNKNAIVVAFNLQPTQLRIADVITRAPDDVEIKNQIYPEIAYIKDNQVYIENFLPQR